MRQINFVLIFALCLALVLFSIENTQSVVIQILPGIQVQAPLAIELILALGLGGVLAWLYGIWNRLLYQITIRGEKRQVKQKNNEIETLQQEVEHYQAELESQQQLLPASESDAEVISS